MRLEERVAGDAVVVTVLDPRIDARSSDDLRAALARIIGEGKSRVVLDLSGVTFVDSSGLGAIIASLKLATLSGDLVLCGARESVASLLRLTRMDKVFRTYRSPQEALVALAGKA